MGMLIPSSFLSQVGRGTVCEGVEGMEIGTDSASGEVARVIYASYMERVIA